MSITSKRHSGILGPLYDTASSFYRVSEWYAPSRNSSNFGEKAIRIGEIAKFINNAYANNSFRLLFRNTSGSLR